MLPSGQNHQNFDNMALYFECRINKNAVLLLRVCPLGRQITGLKVMSAESKTSADLLDHPFFHSISNIV